MTATIDIGTILIAIVGALVSVIAYFLKGLASEMKELQRGQSAQSLSLHLMEASLKQVEEKTAKLPDAAIVKKEMEAAWTRIDDLKKDMLMLKEFMANGESVHEVMRKRIHKMHSQITELKHVSMSIQSTGVELTKDHSFWSLDGE